MKLLKLSLLFSVFILIVCHAASTHPITSLVNTPAVEYGAVQTPFGIYVTRSEGVWGKSGRSSIYKVDSGSGKSQLAAFSSGEHDDSDPFYDPLKNRLCFVSTQPIKPSEQENTQGDIWCVNRVNTSWAKPYRLPEPVNSAAREYSPVFDKHGVLYFASDRKGGHGQGDIYSARTKDNLSWQVENMGTNINSEFGEWNVGVNPAGDELIFEASSKVENISIPGDLYYSRRSRTGEWLGAIPLSTLNTRASDLMARWHSEDRLVYATSSIGNVDHVSVNKDQWQPLDASVFVISRSKGEVVVLDPLTLKEKRRFYIGLGPHELAVSKDGRTSIAPLFGIYPEPHGQPVIKRPPFIVSKSQGIAKFDVANASKRVIPLKNCPRPHGVAVDAQAERIWVTCEEQGNLIEYSNSRSESTNTYKLGKGVHKVIYLQSSNIVLAVNPELGEVYKIDLNSKKTDKVFTGAGAEGIAVNRDGSLAWIANSQAQSVCRLEVESMSKQWCVEDIGTMPIALALADDKKELWVSRFGQRDILIINADNGEKIDTIKLRQGALDLEFNPYNGLIYASVPRLNSLLAINQRTREIQATFDDVMEGDDVDYYAPYAPSPDN